MVRKYKKRTYKPRKRTYKRRTYKRRYYKRRYKPIKKPEIHIIENDSGDITFNNTTYGVGTFTKLTYISSDQYNDIDSVKYIIHPITQGNNTAGKIIDGKKIRLKYLYIKGYIKVGAGSSTEDADDFNCKLMVFRWKRNTTNQTLYWGDLVNSTGGFNVNSPSTWTEDNRLSMMYKQDWNNDIKINFYKKVKNLYRKYDDANNIIPFKIRIPLYDCVLTCDCFKGAQTSLWEALANPSTNGLYFTFLSNKYDGDTVLNYKVKLYYTDY